MIKETRHRLKNCVGRYITLLSLEQYFPWRDAGGKQIIDLMSNPSTFLVQYFFGSIDLDVTLLRYLVIFSSIAGQYSRTID